MAFKSLRSQLLCWLLAPMALVAVIDAVLTYRTAQQTATIVQERMLLGAARMIGEQIHLEEGTVQIIVPPSALELFVSPSRDRVFYRVSTQEGQLLTGYFDLALPPRTLAPEEFTYFDAIQRDKPVRIVAFAQPVFASAGLGPILIEVAQTLEGRDELAREVWLTAIWRQAALLMLITLFLWVGLRRGMLPLLNLRDRVLSRAPGTLEKLDSKPVPSELQPLVIAVNDYVERLDIHMSAHSRFIADASHQLRTPLALLNTQVVYALRNSTPHDRQEALNAIHESVQHAMRLVNQLLTFNMAEASVHQHKQQSIVDLGAIVSHVLETLAAPAQQKQIDLGFESYGPPSNVFAVPHLLQEMVANLVDNALRYTGPGGTVTAVVQNLGGNVQLHIQDNGPGIPVDQQERVFERFVRLQDDYSDGCGLGLAIVREIAKTMNANVSLQTPESGVGLRVTVVFLASKKLSPSGPETAAFESNGHFTAATNSVV